ncbi:MAG TPA: protein translocase subunit SecD, partial [Bacteroidetes bacterium]|nr:protein translocase subunit SecD [Bacteroidota bacterium]
MKGGFRLYATIGLLVIALFYLIYPTTKNERPLNLGLDLQGGMQVTLEVGLEALVRDLATDRDEQFDKVLKAAGANARTSDVDVIATFVQEFEKRDANVRLSRYFRNTDEGITRKSTNAEIQTYLNAQADKAMDAAIKIVRDRVDRFGVAEPSIVKQGTRRISVELPGVANADRVRKLLRGTAQLQFHLMAEQNEVAASLEKIVAFYRDGGKNTPADTSKAAKADTTKKETPKADNSKNPLLAIFTPVGGTAFGVAARKDTAKVAEMFRRPEVRAMMPAGVVPMWAVQPSGEPGKEVYNYLAVRSKVELKGDYITNADTQFDQFTNAPEVSLTMDSEGAGIWSRLTGANVGKQVAITMDNVVYSYPVINEKIPGGRTSINGMGNVEEAKDLVTVLQSGSLPAPVTIVQERTVGPSLGAASIEAGKWSLI